MPAPSAILGFIDPDTLQFLWAAGFAALLFFVCGFLLLRRRGVIHSEPDARVPEPSPAPKEVVRISAAVAPLKTSEMTQQQKIAAALVRAGMSNPAAWAGGVTTADADSPEEAPGRKP